MNKLLFAIFTCFLLLSTARAADLSQPHVTVYGEAEEKVAPDRMVWYLNVNNKGTVLKEVAETHARIVGEILEFLNKADIPGDAVQTSRMRFGENWNYRNSSRVREGYFAATDIMFRLKEMDRYDDFWLKFSEYENLSINSVIYEISDEAKYQEELQRRALLAAREKADHMARVLGSVLGEPLVIEEEQPDSGLPYESARMLASDGGNQGGSQSAVAPGRITLQNRVTVVYRLINSPQ